MSLPLIFKALNLPLNRLAPYWWMDAQMLTLIDFALLKVMALVQKGREPSTIKNN